MSYTDYTIKKIADMTGRTKSPIAKAIKELGIEPYAQGKQIQYYTAEQARVIINKINPAFDFIELDTEIREYKAAQAELKKKMYEPTEEERAAAEQKLIEQRIIKETSQQQVLIDMLKEQLKEKQEQLNIKDEQLKAKDKQIDEKDKQIAEHLKTIGEQTKSLTEQNLIINKQAAAIVEMNTSISQAQQLTLIAQSDKIKEMQREQAAQTAAEQKETENAGAGGGINEQQEQTEKTAANMSFWEKVKFVFKK